MYHPLKLQILNLFDSRNDILPLEQDVSPAKLEELFLNVEFVLNIRYILNRNPSHVSLRVVSLSSYKEEIQLIRRFTSLAVYNKNI